MNMDRYYTPETRAEALQILKKADGDARIVAGATDLYLDIERNRKQAKILVDICHIRDLRKIEVQDDKLFIGATVTHYELETNPIIRKDFTALALGAAAIGSPQIRYIGTIGGNIINAQPAADTAIPLFAFDAQALVLREDGKEEILPIAELYEGPGKSSVDSSKELLVGFYLPLHRYTKSAYGREAKRKALALPILNAAVAIKIGDGGIIEKIGVAAGPVAETPLRLTCVENLLKGEKPTDLLLAKVGELVGEAVNPRDSLLRGFSDYRRDLSKTMISRLIAECLKHG